MFNHMLIPSDLTDHASLALEMARTLGQAVGSRITLLHVIETVSGADVDEFAAFYRELDERACRHLAELASRFDGSGLDVATIVVYGKPIREIVRIAVEQQVDLILLASHRLDPSRPGQGWSTLSYKVGVLAPCPVLLVK